MPLSSTCCSAAPSSLDKSVSATITPDLPRRSSEATSSITATANARLSLPPRCGGHARSRSPRITEGIEDATQDKEMAPAAAAV
jgi:hypothetical protein